MFHREVPYLMESTRIFIYPLELLAVFIFCAQSLYYAGSVKAKIAVTVDNARMLFLKINFQIVVEAQKNSRPNHLISIRNSYI